MTVTPRLYDLTWHPSACVLRFKPELSGYQESELMPELKSTIREIHDRGCKRVIVDLEQLPLFGSLVLEALVQMWKSLRLDEPTESHDPTEENPQMILCGLSEVGREVVALSRLDTIWGSADTSGEALDRFTNGCDSSQ